MPQRNIIGLKFGSLTILKEAPPYRSPGGQPHRKVRCQCDCGAVVEVRLGALRNERTKSCGCIKSAAIKEAKTRHGHTSGGGQTYLYGLWRNVKARVISRNATDYEYYLNLDMHIPWVDDFMLFRDYILQNLGPRPAGTSLDRIDNLKGYHPGNIRWATPQQQVENRRNARLLTYAGETYSVTQWGRKLGIHTNTIRARLDLLNWPVEKALTTPVRSPT